MNNESHVEDLEVLRKVSRGDEGAFRELYEATHRKVYSYLFRLLGGRHTAEDVLVETYAEVWRNANRFRGNSRAITWIIGIARNIAMNELKKVKYHEDIDDYPNLPNGKITDIESFDRKRVLREAMLRLSIKHREVLDLVFFHEMTYPEVSQVMGIPVNTVKTRVFYAKETLRGILCRMGVKRNDI